MIGFFTVYIVAYGGAYVPMDVDDSLDYDKVKAAILYKYVINPQTYRQ